MTRVAYWRQAGGLTGHRSYPSGASLRKDTIMLQLITDFVTSGAYSALFSFIDVVQWNG
ncbi:hypothetical protein [uncultured Serinicoccus sp.]|uniref:hypothetical protein n=1 Tax=uncultured Serinicoccus sp. TaxID=735514 RepID=UPI0026093415|nr:hypothetical protein [uncultured Serinicoccus sp.]